MQCTNNRSIAASSAVDPDPNWICIQELSGSRSVLRTRIRIHTDKNRINWRQNVYDWRKNWPFRELTELKISSGANVFVLFKKKFFFKKIVFILNSSKFFFMIDNITMDMEPDPNWAKIHDPDPKSLYTIWIHNTGGKYSLSRLQMMATTTPFGNFFSSWIAWGARTSMIRRKIRPPHFPTDYGYSVVEPFHFDPALAPASQDGCSGSSSSSVVNFLLVFFTERYVRLCSSSTS